MAIKHIVEINFVNKKCFNDSLFYPLLACLSKTAISFSIEPCNTGRILGQCLTFYRPHQRKIVRDIQPKNFM